MAFNRAAKNIFSETQNTLEHESVLAKQTFEALLKEVRNDIGVIAQSPSFKNFTKNQYDSTATKDLFRALLNNKQNYYQIRLIGIANSGRELIRLDKTSNGIVAKPNRELQEKGDRNYFKSTIKLNEGKIYFSPIDLNQEYGIVTQPYIPTIRAASPLYDESNSAVGIVVINVDLKPLFEKIRSSIRKDHSVLIVDKNGDYVFNADSNKQFGKQLGKDANFNTEYTVERSNTYAKSVLNENDLQSKFVFQEHQLFNFNPSQKLSLVLLTPLDLVLKNAQNIRNEIVHIIALIIALFLALVFFYSRFFAKRIQNITQAIGSYANGKSVSLPLPKNNNDELDLLSDSFLKMKGTIDEKVSELEQSLKETEQAKKDRDNFLQNMSHELRTPLNTISGMTQLLQKNAKNEQNKPIIDALERSAKNLSGLVYDILDHKKLVEGNIELNLQPIQLSELVKSCVSVYQFEAVSKQLLLKTGIDESLAKNCYLIDPLRFEQILSNLIINSIKYTDKGAINITLNVLDQQLILEVEDSGIGMKKEQVAALNSLNTADNNFTEYSKNSFGLGLNIVMDLIRLHNGNLKVKSIEGSGTHFTISIPIAKTTPVEIKNAHETPEFYFSKTLSILHIEDDTSNQLLVNQFLTSNSITVQVATTIAEASSLLNEHSFDLVIADLNLAEGFVANQLQKLKEQFNLPVLILSAEELINTHQFDGALLKPFNNFDLQAMVISLWNQTEYATPDFSKIFDDYDNDNVKLSKVFSILKDEFEQYYQRISQVVITKNQPEWEAIQHRLVVHVKQLKLSNLELVIKTPVANLTTDQHSEILGAIAFYIASIRAVQLTNLTA